MSDFWLCSNKRLIFLRSKMIDSGLCHSPPPPAGENGILKIHSCQFSTQSCDIATVFWLFITLCSKSAIIKSCGIKKIVFRIQITGITHGQADQLIISVLASMWHAFELKKTKKILAQSEKRVLELNRLFTLMYEDNFSDKVSNECENGKILHKFGEYIFC